MPGHFGLLAGKFAAVSVALVSNGLSADLDVVLRAPMLSCYHTQTQSHTHERGRVVLPRTWDIVTFVAVVLGRLGLYYCLLVVPLPTKIRWTQPRCTYYWQWSKSVLLASTAINNFSSLTRLRNLCQTVGGVDVAAGEESRQFD